MKRCVVGLKESYVNIEADRMVQEESLIFVYLSDKLQGVFDLGAIDYIFIAEKKNEKI